MTEEQKNMSIDKTIENEIFLILQEKSGGVKMTELIVKITHKFQKDPNIKIFKIIESGKFDSILENIPNIKVYDYDWDMENGDGTGFIRNKQFVCTKF